MPERLPIDRLELLRSVLANDEFLRLVEETEAGALEQAIHAADPGLREAARQQFLCIVRFREMVRDRMAALEAEVAASPQSRGQER